MTHKGFSENGIFGSCLKLSSLAENLSNHSFSPSFPGIVTIMSASFSIGTGLTEAEMEPVRNFLNNALQAKQNGQPLQYQIVVQQFKVKDDPETLWKVVIALNSFASLLTSR